MYAVDYMALTRGSIDDYDRWAKVTGDQGWSWNSLFPYMLKVNLQFEVRRLHPDNSQYIFQMERLTPTVNKRDIAGEFNPKAHGYSGTSPYLMTFEKRVNM